MGTNQLCTTCGYTNEIMYYKDEFLCNYCYAKFSMESLKKCNCGQCQTQIAAMSRIMKRIESENE